MIFPDKCSYIFRDGMVKHSTVNNVDPHEHTTTKYVHYLDISMERYGSTIGPVSSGDMVGMISRMSPPYPQDRIESENAEFKLVMDGIVEQHNNDREPIGETETICSD